MKLLLIYPPFCTPTAMPYSLAALKSNLIASLQLNIQCLDLNAYFHTIQFPTYYQNLQLAYQQGLTTYGKLLQDFENESREIYEKFAVGGEALLIGRLNGIVILRKLEGVEVRIEVKALDVDLKWGEEVTFERG